MLTIKPISDAVPTKTLEASQDQAGRIFQAMSPGRVLDVEVVQGGQGNALLKWGNFHFRAESQLPLREGQTLHLLVTENAARITLKNLSNNSLAVRNWWPLLTEKNLLPRLLNAIQFEPHLLSAPLNRETVKSLELFRAFQDGAGNLDLEDIKSFFRLLGFEWSSVEDQEARDAQGKTLKSCLQELLAGLKEPASDLGKRLEAVIEGLGTVHVEGREGKTGNAGFIFLPLPFLDKGCLVFEKPDEANRVEGNLPWRLSLFLETGSLGELQVDFLEHDNGLLVKFISASPEVKKFLESCGDDFKKYFTALPLRSLTFETAAVPPGNSLLKRMAGNKGVLETWV